MSSNGTKDKEPSDPRSIYHHPILCEIEDREGRYGPFQNFRLTRPYFDEGAERQKSNWHTLNQNTVTQLQRLADHLQKELDAQTKNNGKPKNRTASTKKKKKKASKQRSALG